ncbi:hypothetical protein CBR_g19892 [Chara braunii]|uniref:Uncharacterized protein n=1 Tax=Chara braunii TaxID=69332 RepID=A0A388KZ08_CHABU|nr:hypothetical protein CBR_g19892 [Chara braunii]|eukprot:GBG75258.1 hypothetical protein CBR_g19892 [Chara braunii]
MQVQDAHRSDVHCVDWNGHHQNLIITGSADCTINLFDRRNLSGVQGKAGPICTLRHGAAAVLCVQWCPDKPTVLGSCSEDGVVNIWDIDKVRMRAVPPFFSSPTLPPSLPLPHPAWHSI